MRDELRAAGYECQCCFEQVEGRAELWCSGPVRHRFCAGCVCKQRSGHSGGRTPCIMERACLGILSAAVEEVAARELARSIAERAEAERQVHDAGLEGYWRCPFCQAGVLWEGAEAEAEAETEFQCGNELCRRRSCWKCQRSSHPGCGCGPLVAVLCVGCGRGLGREREGHNMVECSCMGVKMCLVCGQDVTASGYRHFNPRKVADLGEGRDDRRCRLWEDPSGDGRCSRRVHFNRGS